MKSRKISIIRNFAGLCFVLLAGCGTTPRPVTQRVDVPVPVSCVKAEDVPKRPDYAVEKLTPTASTGEKVLALASDWPRGRKYEGQLEAVIAGCR
ncbi:hypothetical protein GTP38_11445 [Duganella sp. FT94W]|uniref:Lipoprotein n=1 Tax=Duganella lactea TaxID=2692173 RepID=A0ABW9V7M9_9BURK|nr:hypothetical protein [Duganella lactea]MYM34951.1 hypothetical protein [Duganella lactea]